MISILTATYNRAYLLPQLYESLKRQTNKNFEWIIIDDGSKDRTEEIVDSWISKNKEFEIKKIYQENAGKHRAINRGVLKAKYDYVFIVDSDDYILDDTIESILTWLKTISGKDVFAGVAGIKGIMNSNEIIGGFPEGKEYVDASNLERKKKNLTGDKAEVYRRDLLIKFPFPEIENEKFITENAVWNKIAMEGYKIRWFNKLICMCEYREDGISRKNQEDLILNNFGGFTYVQKLKSKCEKFPMNIIAVGTYYYYANKKSIKNEKICNNLGINYLTLIGARTMNMIVRPIKNKRRTYW